MIKYHGTPISPMEVFYKCMPNKNALISYAHNGDFARTVEICDKIIIDNGAFSFWTKRKKVDWNKYYDWIREIINDIDYFIIPDVIDGTEEENDNLIKEFFKKFRQNIGQNPIQSKAIPVWHIDESFDRLRRMMEIFKYIAIGSSGDFAILGTTEWHKRMNEVMHEVCDSDGVPKVKLHMLRCLDPLIFTRYPFYSGDSTNVARNHHRLNYSEMDILFRDLCECLDGWKPIMRNIERYNSPKKYSFVDVCNRKQVLWNFS